MASNQSGAKWISSIHYGRASPWRLGAREAGHKRQVLQQAAAKAPAALALRLGGCAGKAGGGGGDCMLRRSGEFGTKKDVPAGFPF